MSDFGDEIPNFLQPPPQQQYVTYANIPSNMPIPSSVVVSKASIFSLVKQTPENEAIFKQATLEEARDLPCWSWTDSGSAAIQQILDYCQRIGRPPHHYFIVRYSKNANDIVITICDNTTEAGFEHYIVKYVYEPILGSGNLGTYNVKFNPVLFVDVNDKRRTFRHIFQVINNLVDSGKYFQCFLRY